MRNFIVGVDEAGRGPLVGSVVASAVLLDPDKPIEGLKDSKKLSEKKRLLLADEIKSKALDYAIAEATYEEIDKLNILQASLLAMQRAVMQINVAFEKVQVDGPHVPALDYVVEGIIGGDRLIPAISAASILAKVARDQQMIELAEQYPEYGFEQHKGYPTKAHFTALSEYGPTPYHRRSFKPVREAMIQHAE